MFFRKYLVLFCLFTFSSVIIAQQNTTQKKSNISGKIFDANDGSALQLVNVIIFNAKDSTQEGGAATDKNGYFILSGIDPGNYFIDIKFIGYGKERINDIKIISGRNLDLGKINLKPSSVELDNVVVKGNRSPITYSIDKKIIDVSQLQTVTSGNAADVLENIPSVSVDADGNISIRGSGSFTVLIDGRPSVMDAQDILQQIPASSIKTIELITNPSAKYDAEGNAGIIDIKLKKNENLGLSGLVNANTGLNKKYGGDFLLEYKTQTINYNFGANYNNRYYPGDRNEFKQFNIGSGNTSYLNSNGSNGRERKSFSLKSGINFNIGENNYLSFGGRYGYRDGGRNSFLNYTQWSDANPNQDFYTSQNDRGRSGYYYAFNTNYNLKFDQKGHELSVEFFASHRNSDESTISSEFQNGAQFSGRKTTETGPSTRYRGKIDFSLPFGESSKFEAGSQGEMDLSTDGTDFFEFNNNSDQYEYQPNYSNVTDYNRSELALYSIYSVELGNLGLQGGVRGEYTYRTIELTRTNQNFSIDRWDFFPTIHSSFKFSDGSQLMGSYTRRIDRPHGWQLEPFKTWMDANNLREGNPALKPEFIDSYELGFQTFIGEITFSNDFYYRVSHNKIERVNSSYSENVTLNTVDNVGTDYSLGSEFMFTFSPVELWNVNLMGDIYHYKINGALNNIPFERSSLNWSTRFNNEFKFSDVFQIQFNVRYNSPRVSSQGRREGYFRTDAAVKRNFFGKLLTLTLQVRDLFGTGKYEYTSESPDYYSYSHFTREAPRVMLNLKLNFNNFSDTSENNDRHHD
ncbi:MAG TPA: TonB-dependent receptor [Ignavibacteriaceae bacterium]|nr:TonB-dependent receptor [Ignavibacteriaceae bacterium]